MNDQRGSIFNFGSTINQQNVHNYADDKDRETLLNQLISLREALANSAEPADRKTSAAREIDAAVEAARRNEKDKAKSHLQNIGMWILEFCSNIGANLVSSMITGK